MKSPLTFLVAVLAISVGSARADIRVGVGVEYGRLSAPGLAAQPAATAAGASSAKALPAQVPDSLSTVLNGAGWGAQGAQLLLSPRMGVVPVVPGVRSVNVVRNVPALPGSAAMFLSGLLSMGGWCVLRSSVKHLNFSAVPEWYHTGGPDRIGHAVPFDLDAAPLPICCFEQPAGTRPFLYRARREHFPLGDAQCFLLITAPRGPPALS